MESWWPRVGVGGGIGMGNESSPHSVKISLCLVWPTQCLNRCEHLNINRLLSKAGFPRSLEKSRRSWAYVPTKYQSTRVECRLPLRSPPSLGHHNPKSSAIVSTWHPHTSGFLIPGIQPGVWHMGSSQELGDPSSLLLKKAKG